MVRILLLMEAQFASEIFAGMALNCIERYG